MVLVGEEGAAVGAEGVRGREFALAAGEVEDEVGGEFGELGGGERVVGAVEGEE